MTNKNITLNVWKDNSEFAMAVQGEVDSRFLTISLRDNDGPIDLTNKTVNFLAKKPDGTVVFNRMEVEKPSDGIAVLELTSQMSAVPGFLEGCEVHIMSEIGETLIAKKINILVQPSLGEAAEESLSELTAFQELIKSAEKIDAHITDKLNPHEVTATQVGALPIDTKYGAMLEQDGSKLNLKDQNGELLSTVAVSNSTSNYNIATPAANGLMSADDKAKLDGIEAGANVNIQSDWAQADIGADDYIKNKPSIPANLTDLAGTLPISQGGTGSDNVLSALANLQIYTSVNQLNLAYPCTTVDILNAMPSKSMFVVNVESMSSTITDAPVSWGMIKIVKYNNSRREIDFIRSMGTDCDRYVGGFDSSAQTITWKYLNNTGTLTIAKGGTGATSAEQALTNLGAASLTSVGDVSSLLTTSKTVVEAINELYSMINS